MSNTNAKVKALEGKRVGDNWIKIDTYEDSGRPCISLVDKYGLPYERITINIPEEELEDNEVIVKVYSENELIIPQVRHLFEDTGKRARAIMAPIWRVK